MESKREDCCDTFKSKNYSKFCFLRMPKLRKLIFGSGSEGRKVYDL